VLLWYIIIIPKVASGVKLLTGDIRADSIETCEHACHAL
jgi:hypothetical protein